MDRNISSSKTKFYHVVAVLPQEVASQILDLIRAPPLGDPYEVLWDRLVRLYTLNDYQRFEALVSLTLSGDLKPSHFLNQMLSRRLQAGLCPQRSVSPMFSD